MWVFRVGVSGRGSGGLVAQRAGARARRAQPRGDVHQAVKDGRLLHHAPRSRTRPTHAHLRMLMSHNVQRTPN